MRARVRKRHSFDELKKKKTIFVPPFLNVGCSLHFEWMCV